MTQDKQSEDHLALAETEARKRLAADTSLERPE